MAEVAAASAALCVDVVYSSEAGQAQEWSLQLPGGACLLDALRAVGLEASPCAAGIWGRRAERSQLLQDGDRVELYRPLLVDPKVARRERFARQGARGAGLFSRQRPGGKAGY
ncbi:RnfH family protein [Acidovorax sp. CCYZU-2555]|uniref:RnfH family protein n=1 Tax=Acidovorax sp. CCYZU-2555 TaxID=2835042 RepID=UPI001BCBD0A7|nr:RnfH family protein [Acidovorax sp. CCYZU-2555]MBS7780352.1 RnfH family protein [Acidovorax sp. CCYZU-2555]